MADARKTALAALLRIDDGAYANLVVPALLEQSELSMRDRAFVTNLTYGTTRMRRACDWLIDRFLSSEPPPVARAVLRLGTYQLVYLGTPPHAAVSATVGVAPPRLRGLANAVLRRVAAALPVDWPDDATRLSYPDWILERLTADLGAADALGALEQMNAPGHVHERDDGYVQDPASQHVAAHVGVMAGDVVLDACAGPGGKATLMASAVPAIVAAVDVHPQRAGLVAANAHRLDASAVCAVAADSRQAPWRPAAFDRALVDAPCSGLGVLGRRPDARWRMQPGDVANLAALQRAIVAATIPLVRPGGILVYAACTLTAAESIELDGWLEHRHPDLRPDGIPPAPWRPYGRGARLLPQDAGTDGMYVLRLRLDGR
jgi:16S rRNA (cytosine967-C5)-methyltransferase